MLKEKVQNLLQEIGTSPKAFAVTYREIAKAGGEVYLVGGAVRDMILGQQPKDYDLLVCGLSVQNVIAALSSQKSAFVDVTGKDFGIIRFVQKFGDEVEIALPRTEKSVGVKRADFDVSVDPFLPIEADLLRRDFSMNAMAIRLSDGELIDPYRGQEALSRRQVKTILSAAFREDPTRMLRALSFVSRFGFDIDPLTYDEMVLYCRNVARESPERVAAELDKILSGSPENLVKALRLAQKTGLLRYVLPELGEHFNFDQNNKYHSYTLGEHTIAVVENVAKITSDKDVRLAALLHDIGKPDAAWVDPKTGYNHYYKSNSGEGLDHDVQGANLANKRLRALKFPNARRERIVHLVRHHMFGDFTTSKGARKFLARVGPAAANDILDLREADRSGKGLVVNNSIVDKQRQLIATVLENGAALSIKDLEVNGNDLMKIGLKGPEIGDTLRHLLHLVIENPDINHKPALLALCKR